jgi:hypothetical protein
MQIVITIGFDKEKKKDYLNQKKDPSLGFVKSKIEEIEDQRIYNSCQA